MPRRPAIAEQQDQFACMFDRVAEVRGVEPEIGERPAGGGPAGLPIRVARELADFFGASDAGDRSRRAGFGGAYPRQSDEADLRRENGRKSESHSGLKVCSDVAVTARGSASVATDCLNKSDARSSMNFPSASPSSQCLGIPAVP
jgi:hypothetical protein